MKGNSIRRAVREERAALGTGLKEFVSRGVPWIIEAAGFDYCAIDHEHGAFDLETIANLASWFQATNVTAIVCPAGEVSTDREPGYPGRRDVPRPILPHPLLAEGAGSF